jgi:hypothetical protein
MYEVRGKMEKLAVGEKYLRIQLVGHSPVGAFKNKDKKNAKDPDYRGDGVAVWINEKKQVAKDDRYGGDLL